MRAKISLGDNITSNFYWSEALYLPSWDMYAFPSDEEVSEIIKLANIMEEIRKIFNNKPIKIHSWLRPKFYNTFIGSKAPDSAHIYGKACDFTIQNTDTLQARETLRFCLSSLNIRMEKLSPSDNWIHIDTRDPINNNRYFTP